MLRRSALLFLLTGCLQTGEAWGRTYALVIGIDDYRFLPDLHGAVNDANDIADALRSAGAEVVTLLDADASRAAILTEWRRLASGIGTGDQLIVSYAGHGSNEPESTAGNELDSRDETLILSGFSPVGAPAAERIRDDEIADLIALAGEGRTIFVADACHSGTLSRTLAPALGYRYVSVGKIEADPLPPPPPRAHGDDGRETAALFLGAADDSEKTPEFLIDGHPRGALSYSFASAIRGAADTDGDGILTKREIETHVRKTIRSVSDGSQRPQVAPAGEGDRIIFQVGGAAARPIAATASAAPVFASLAPVTVSLTGVSGEHPLHGTLAGVTLVAPRNPADLRVDLRFGTITSMVGDLVGAFAPDRPSSASAAIQAAADTHRLTAAIRGLQSDLEVGFQGGDRTYRHGEEALVEIAGRRSPYLTLLGIAPDGVISVLYPRPELGDPPALSVDMAPDLVLQVTPPFGADLIVAIETPRHATELDALLSSVDGSQGVSSLWDGLRPFFSRPDLRPRIGAFAFFSSGD